MSNDTKMARHLTEARDARVKWWQDARKKTITEFVNRSPEVEIWKSAEAKSLAPLMSLLTRIEAGHKELEDLLTSVLSSLGSTFKRLVPSSSKSSPDFSILNYAIQKHESTAGMFQCMHLETKACIFRWDLSIYIETAYILSCNPAFILKMHIFFHSAPPHAGFKHWHYHCFL